MGGNAQILTYNIHQHKLKVASNSKKKESQKATFPQALGPRFPPDELTGNQKGDRRPLAGGYPIYTMVGLSRELSLLRPFRGNHSGVSDPWLRAVATQKPTFLGRSKIYIFSLCARKGSKLDHSSPHFTVILLMESRRGCPFAGAAGCLPNAGAPMRAWTWPRSSLPCRRPFPARRGGFGGIATEFLVYV